MTSLESLPGTGPELKDFVKLFESRAHWPNACDPQESNELMRSLMALRRDGQLHLHCEEARKVPRPRYTSRTDVCEPGPMHRRNGSELLLDDTWSAHQHLKRKYPRASLEAFCEVPCGYLHRKSATFITTGNLEPARMLQFVVRQKISNLGILSSRWRVGAEFPIVDKTATTGAPTVCWLAFSPQAIETFDEYFKAKMRRLVALLDELSTC